MFVIVICVSKMVLLIVMEERMSTITSVGRHNKVLYYTPITVVKGTHTHTQQSKGGMIVLNEDAGERTDRKIPTFC